MSGNDRITVTLMPRTREELTALTKSTGMSQTDLVNRALSLLAMVEQETASGRSDLLLRNRENGDTTLVRLL